jgi:hypothetical protein
MLRRPRLTTRSPVNAERSPVRLIVPVELELSKELISRSSLPVRAPLWVALEVPRAAMRASAMSLMDPLAVVLFSKRMAPRLPEGSSGPVPAISIAFATLIPAVAS